MTAENKKPGSMAGFRYSCACCVNCALWEKYAQFPVMSIYLCRLFFLFRVNDLPYRLLRLNIHFLDDFFQGFP